MCVIMSGESRAILKHKHKYDPKILNGMAE